MGQAEAHDSPKALDGQPYHETQKHSRCAIHTVNNLLQKQVYTRADFENFNTLTKSQSDWFGNYSVNVIILALKKQSFSISWFNKTKDPATIDLEGIFGIVINRTIKGFLGIAETLHWSAFRKIGDSFFHLDSLNEQPHQFKSNQEAITFLRSILAEGGELICVVPQGFGKVY